MFILTNKQKDVDKQLDINKQIKIIEYLSEKKN